MISDNTAALQAILAAVNALPNASGGGGQLPTLSNPGTANDLAAGLQLIDANGNVVTGNIPVYPSWIRESVDDIYGFYIADGWFTYIDLLPKKTIVESTIVTSVDASVFGDATEADVVQGKKFTSKNGLAKVGTYVPSSGGGGSGGLPAGISALTAGTVTPTEDNTSGVIVTHSLGVVPNFCAWFVAESYSGGVATSVAVAGAIINKASKYTSTSSISYNIHYVIDGYSSSSQQTTTSGRVSNQTYLTATQARLVCNSSYKIKAGKQINWVVGVVDGVL